MVGYIQHLTRPQAYCCKSHQQQAYHAWHKKKCVSVNTFDAVYKCCSVMRVGKLLDGVFGEDDEEEKVEKEEEEVAEEEGEEVRSAERSSVDDSEYTSDEDAFRNHFR
jgi:hypothetical protein